MDRSMKISAHLAILEPKVEEICIGIDIENHYRYVKEYNPSNNLPYHNWYHTVCMVWNCFEAASYYNLTMPTVRAICVAALWHDYNHSGGKLDDAINVLNANEAFLKFHLSLLSSETRPHDSDLSHVPSIIGITQYPYIAEPMCIEQRIIRDADLMQITFPTADEMCIEALGKEISVKEGVEITRLDMLAGQIKFLKDMKMYTSWGRERLKTANITQIINGMIMQKDLLQSKISAPSLH